MGIEAYPLCWPEGWKRTPYHARTVSKFQTSFTRARDFLFEELRRMGAQKPVLSTNLNLRRDGLPLANQRNPEDPGAAVYFGYKPKGSAWNAHPKSMVLACDHYRKVEENIYAIGKTIEALRGIERWGASDMMERAFTGFAALPSSTAVRSWREVLRIVGKADLDLVARQYRMLAGILHPDSPTGSHEAMVELNAAREAALKELQ